MATRSKQTTVHAILDVLLELITLFMGSGAHPAMWREDTIGTRRVLHVCAGHLWAKRYMTQPRSLNYGALSAVMGRSAFGEFTSHVFREDATVVVTMYVGNYFGVVRQGPLAFEQDVRPATFAHRAPCDKNKALFSIARFIPLGSETSIKAAQWPVAVRLAKEKVRKHCDAIGEVLPKGPLPFGTVMKLVGGLPLSCTAAGLCGRAYPRPFYRQTNEPHLGLAWLVALVSHWWEAYTTSSALRWIRLSTARRSIRIYSDAFGAVRLVAVAIRLRDGEGPDTDKWFWIRLQLSEGIWDFFLDREDLKIGIQELVALCPAVQTFAEWVRGSNWRAWCDNQDCTCAVRKGESKSAGPIWSSAKFGYSHGRTAHLVPRLPGCLRQLLGRRPYTPPLDHFEFLNAQWLDPELPTFLTSIWAVPEIEELNAGIGFSDHGTSSEAPDVAGNPQHYQGAADFAEVAGIIPREG